ncbi:Acyl-CoA dehydrogenase, C-terminal domain [Arenibacter nanhaiticus]|uniref:Acyl-CoA dehydrogenase, C-terminal domain n=1 Tax=Arenibacter nanhaiticus TaxID=558155 RepID=A0A1M6CWS6_9FLAO|nr:acyl-CoA dehydrogenase [Arenibacter nanhaiticus]SHI65472.1 Acyl-CoA dehydrogenase, C-terminal domain [Arenibacter nanhaiticus]
MKESNPIEQLRNLCLNAKQFPAEVLDWIAVENLWSLWVPQKYGGLEFPFTAGLNKLKSLAKIDGSLGWTVTLCSGANFFIGNLHPVAIEEIFGKGQTQVCFGGSGGVFGSAEKQGDTYNISGKWHYATGASYLTHFTLNAKIIENGEALRNEDGSPMIRSFLLPKDKVEIVENWNTMGLKASVTHSFDVKEVIVDKKYSFLYNRVNLDYPIFKIPFSVFADLTLWVNYIGMAEHFLEEAGKLMAKERLIGLEAVLDAANGKVFDFAHAIEKSLQGQWVCNEDTIGQIHSEAVASVQHITKTILEYYPLLGVSASREDHQLNQIFRDYFTATQHHIFTK